MVAALLLVGMATFDPPAEAMSAAPPVAIYANRVDYGFLFVDGEYLSAPYTIVETDSHLMVNQKQIDCLFPQPEPGGQQQCGQTLESLLLRGSVVMVDSGKMLNYVNRGSDVQSVLRCFTSTRLSDREAAGSLKQLDSADWLVDYHPSQQLVRRASEELAKLRKNRQQTKARISGSRRNASMAFPLTIFGMLAGVWSLGHLLSTSPRLDEVEGDYSANPVLVRATSYSILGVFLLSGLDLIWTLIAGQTGRMRELNPLGSRLMDNPDVLVGFKAVATIIGCGVLYHFRRNQRARQAAWWLCLVLTLLTFRWLVFNSMNFPA